MECDVVLDEQLILIISSDGGAVHFARIRCLIMQAVTNAVAYSMQITYTLHCNEPLKRV